LYRDSNKAAFLTSAFLLLLFSFSHVRRAVSYSLSAAGLLEHNQNLVRGEFADFVWLLTWAALLLLIAVLLWKYQGDLSLASRVLRLIAWAAFLTVLGHWMYREFRTPSGKIEAFVSTWKTSSPFTDIQPERARSDPLPDIYYIILDGMGREDVLITYYQLDLTDFLSNLEQHGFYIADKSFSNYAWTELSLPSSLNFIYLEDLNHLGPATSAFH
jgi:hypothetical protein